MLRTGNHYIIGKHVNFVVKLTDTEKMGLITRYLPESLAPTFIYLSSIGMECKSFLTTMRAEIEQRKAKPVADTTLQTLAFFLHAKPQTAELQRK